ncbi:CASP-like protein 4A1 [Cervus canadensis]|uniref:CASP-like protein 4A1 n=1 Tax=Cervus canadensis TaxID=1574408 RepID=UPI001CA37A46|nr:CASP-like protein 4A1 [Cervus canadensis]
MAQMTLKTALDSSFPQAKAEAKYRTRRLRPSSGDVHLARQRAEASPLGAAPKGSQSRTAFAQIPPPEAAPQPQVARRARPPPAPPIATPAALPVMPRG